MQVIFAPPGSLSYAGLRPLLVDLQRGASVDSLLVDLSRVEFAYPGAMVPISAIISEMRQDGVGVDVRLPDAPMMQEYFAKAGWASALLGTEVAPARSFRNTFVPLVHFSDHRTLTAAIDSTIDVVSGVAEYPTGVLKAIEWSLNEVADNVLLHAGSGVEGWMQAIATPKHRRIEFAVADRGRGILASLRERYVDLSDHRRALEMAIEAGTTRDSSIGQGNGLSGSVRIAKSMHGWVNLLSGLGELRLMDDGKMYTRPSPMYSGTLVDLTLPTSAEVDVAEALWGKEPVSRLELTHLVGDGVVFRVRDESTGFGNRGSGLEVANKLTNLLNETPGVRITVDFEGVDFVSASFADEFLAKLVKRYGVGTFLARVSLTNMSSLVGRTVNVVIAQRMSSDA